MSIRNSFIISRTAIQNSMSDTVKQCLSMLPGPLLMDKLFEILLFEACIVFCNSIHLKRIDADIVDFPKFILKFFDLSNLHLDKGTKNELIPANISIFITGKLILKNLLGSALIF